MAILRRGCQHTESGRVACPRDIGQDFSLARNREKNVRTPGSLRTKGPCTWFEIPGFGLGGLWLALMTRGRLLTWQSARLSSRYQLSERPILVPRNREV